MSKSVGNVVNPDVVIDAYGADSLRLFEMFLDLWKPSNHGVKKESKACTVSFEKFTASALTEKHNTSEETNKDTLKVLHETIFKVTEAIEDLRFNVAITNDDPGQPPPKS